MHVQLEITHDNAINSSIKSDRTCKVNNFKRGESSLNYWKGWFYRETKKPGLTVRVLLTFISEENPRVNHYSISLVSFSLFP